MRHRDSEAHLFEHGKVEQLTGRVHLRMKGLVGSICGRLVGMGMCSAQCPCAEYQQVGMPWLEDEIAEALTKQRFSDNGMLDVRLVDDDFRRRWNKARGLVQEPLNNKILRSGKITDWGSRFLQSLRANPSLKDCSAGDDIRLLELTESWLRHLWDDASDNADMTSIREGGFSEMWYVHPENFWRDDTKRRYGYRADRLWRRRTSDDELRSMDELLPEHVRPSLSSPTKEAREAENNEFHKVSRICDALFTAVEAADAKVERYQDGPTVEGSSISESEISEKLQEFGVSMRRSASGKLEISSDDLDRLDDGIVDNMNPRALFDDFAAAWAMTRMNMHEQITLLNQSIDGPSGTSQETFGDRLVAPEEMDDGDDEDDEAPGESNDSLTAN